MSRTAEHRDTGGMSQYEIAAILGISQPAVRKIEQKALAKLRPLLSLDLIPDEPRVDASIYI